MHDATIAAPTLVESSQIFLTVCASKHQGRVEVSVLHVCSTCGLLAVIVGAMSSARRRAIVDA